VDLSIRPVTPEIMRERGAQAFDDGRGIDDHHMNPGAPAIEDWQKGWRDRRAAVHALLLVKHCLGEVSPP
jgi:hypothetical protein